MSLSIKDYGYNTDGEHTLLFKVYHVLWLVSGTDAKYNDLIVYNDTSNSRQEEGTYILDISTK